jgi:hypothetical protein
MNEAGRSARAGAGSGQRFVRADEPLTMSKWRSEGTLTPNVVDIGLPAG